MKNILLILLLITTLCSCSSNNSTINVKDRNSAYNNSKKVTQKFKDKVVINNKNKVNISVLLPLEGDNADISKTIVDAIQLAYYNSNNKAIFIRFYNTFSNGKNISVQAAKDAVDGGAEIIIGPLFSSDVKKVAQVAAQKNIPVITFANDRSILQNTDNVYLAGYSPEAEVERIVDYIVNTKHASRFVAIVPKNEYGKIVLSALAEALKVRGLTLVRYSAYPPDTINFSSSLEALIDPDALSKHKDAVQEYNDAHSNVSTKSVISLKDYPELPLDFDTIFVADSGLKLMLLGAHFPYLGISANKVNLISTRLATSAKLYKEPIFNNIKIPDFIDLQNTIFASKVFSIFKQKPSLVSAAAYDVVQMIASMVTLNQNTNTVQYDFSKENFNNKHILGVLGSYVIREDGIIQRHMEVKGVANDGYKTVEDSGLTDDNFMKVTNYKKVPLFDFSS